jgi:hypothetical protein
VPETVASILKPEEVFPFFTALELEQRPPFATAILTGLRKNEICGLQKPDVDLAPAAHGAPQLRAAVPEEQAAACRERAPHVRREPRLGAAPARPLGPEDHRVPLRAPLAGLHAGRGEPPPVRHRPARAAARAGAAAPERRWRTGPWHDFTSRGRCSHAVWCAGGAKRGGCKGRGRNPRNFSWDSGLFNGGEYETRNRWDAVATTCRRGTPFCTKCGSAVSESRVRPRQTA